MMVDSDPTDRTRTTDHTHATDHSYATDHSDTTDRAGEAEPRRSGRRHWRRGPVEDNAGWTIFSYLISGMVFYGLVGWLVGRATHIAVLFPLGAIAGLVMAIVLIIFKYGRP